MSGTTEGMDNTPDLLALPLAAWKIRQEVDAKAPHLNAIAKIPIQREVDVEPDELAWMEDGACKGPQSIHFYPPSTFSESKDEREKREALAISWCNTCKVADACLEFALKIKEPHGVWGGKTEEERRKLILKQRAS